MMLNDPLAGAKMPPDIGVCNTGFGEGQPRGEAEKDYQ